MQAAAHQAITGLCPGLIWVGIARWLPDCCPGSGYFSASEVIFGAVARSAFPTNSHLRARNPSAWCQPSGPRGMTLQLDALRPVKDQRSPPMQPGFLRDAPSGQVIGSLFRHWRDYQLSTPYQRVSDCLALWFQGSAVFRSVQPSGVGSTPNASHSGENHQLLPRLPLTRLPNKPAFRPNSVDRASQWLDCRLCLAC